MTVIAATRNRVIASYIAMAMCCFATYTILLALIPAIGVRNGLTPLEIGGLTAVLAGFGLLTDLPLAHLARLYGDRIVILGGGALGGLACAMLYFAAIDIGTSTSIVLLRGSAFVGAIGFSCLIAPLLGGIASHAQGAQIQVQAVNSIAQRIGAFGASILLSFLFASGDLRLGPALALAICIAIIVLARGVKAPMRVLEHAVEDRAVFDLKRFLHMSTGVKKGLFVSISVQCYLISSYAFIPVLLDANGIGETLGLSLAFREIVAVLSAALIGTWFNRDSLSTIWAVSAFVGLVSLAIVPFITDPFSAVALFSLHGAALGIGIVAGNVHAYFGTIPATRIYGFAYMVMATRLAGLVVPIILGAALERSASTFSLVVFVFLLALLLMYLTFDDRPGFQDQARRLQ